MSVLWRLRYQVLRRALQLGVVAFVLYGAALVPWRNLKRAHDSSRLVELLHGETWSALYRWNDRLLGVLDEGSYQASLSITGMPWAARLLGFTTADPLLVAGTAAASGRVPYELLPALLLPVLLAVLFGKVFCSHLCPARLLFDLGQAVRRGLARLGVPLIHLRARPALGGYVLLGGLFASSFAGAGVWLLLLPYAALSGALFLGVATGTLSGLALVAGAWLVVETTLSPGLFCRSLCPTGYLLERLGRFRVWRLTKDASSPCPSSCRVCVVACPYGLSPRTGEHDDACDGCGICAAACPSRKLARRFLVRRSLPVLTSLAALLIVGLGHDARAHHNKGLPHYGYFENYPQVPTEEHVVIQGGWEMGATVFNFQGLTRRTADTPSDVKIYLYLYDLVADAAYAGPVSFSLEKGGQEVARFDRAGVDQDSVYATRETLPESGEYVIVARLPQDPPVRVELPFEISIGSETVNWWLVGGLGAPVLLVFGLALLGRSRRRSRPANRSALPAALALLLALFPSMAAAQNVTSLHDGAATLVASAPEAHPQHAHGEGAAGEHLHDVDPRAPIAIQHDGHTMLHYRTEDGGMVMVMAGLPLWVFLLGVALILALSFIVVERFGGRRKWDFRKNVAKDKRVYSLLKSRWLQAIPQLLMVAVLAFLLYAALAGSRVQNIAPVAIWTVWWGGLIFAIALLGPVFCFACPWDGLANLATRLRAAARVDTLSLKLPYPDKLKNLYPAIALFAALTWLELGFGVTTDPRTTAYMGLAMAVFAVLLALLFDGKRFCAHACPVGRISGMYANFSPVEVRARNPSVCVRCTSEDCRSGNELGYPCPTGLSLKTLDEATYCLLCTECFKSCKKHNVALNLRPFGADLDKPRPARSDEAWLCISLLALTLFHGLTMTPAWHSFAPGSMSFLKWMSTTLRTPEVFNFSVGMAAAMALPAALYWLSCRVASALSATGPTTGQLFVHYSYSLLPVALFYHLAHNAMHLLMEVGHIVPLLSDPLGHGDDWLGTSGMHVGALLSERPLWVLQVGLILVGHVFGILVAHRIGHRIYQDKRAATRSLVPMLIMMILISVAGLGLMHLDMNMRVGRM